MNIYDILLIILIAVIFILALRKTIKDRASGKCNCGCSDGCSGKSFCTERKNRGK